MALPSEWRIDPATHPMVVNQFMLRMGLSSGAEDKPSGIYLTLGHVTPPALPPGAAPAELLEEYGPIPITPAGHFYIPLGFAEDLRDNLTQIIEALRGSGHGL